MNKTMLDDFIRYAKEQFNCEISVKKSSTPDTFKSIFGVSFLDNENNTELEDNILFQTVSYSQDFLSGKITQLSEAYSFFVSSHYERLGNQNNYFQNKLCSLKYKGKDDNVSMKLSHFLDNGNKYAA